MVTNEQSVYFEFILNEQPQFASFCVCVSYHNFICLTACFIQIGRLSHVLQTCALHMSTISYSIWIDYYRDIHFDNIHQHHWSLHSLYIQLDMAKNTEVFFRVWVCAWPDYVFVVFIVIVVFLVYIKQNRIACCQ